MGIFFNVVNVLSCFTCLLKNNKNTTVSAEMLNVSSIQVYWRPKFHLKWNLWMAIWSTCRFSNHLGTNQLIWSSIICIMLLNHKSNYGVPYRIMESSTYFYRVHLALRASKQNKTKILLCKNIPPRVIISCLCVQAVLVSLSIHSQIFYPLDWQHTSPGYGLCNQRGMWQCLQSALSFIVVEIT